MTMTKIVFAVLVALAMYHYLNRGYGQDLTPEERARAAIESASRPPHQHDDGMLPRDYAEAYARAVREGKTLVVWTGEAICMPCVKANMKEFVMFPKRSHPAFPDNTLTIGVPVQGSLMMAGQVHEWPDGHLPTIRRVLDEWRRARRTILSAPRLGRPAMSPHALQMAPALPSARR